MNNGGTTMNTLGGGGNGGRKQVGLRKMKGWYFLIFPSTITHINYYLFGITFCDPLEEEWWNDLNKDKTLPSTIQTERCVYFD